MTESFAPVQHTTPSQFSYFKFKLEAPVQCDIDFRKFMTCQIPAAHVMPLKTGATLKSTQQGVLRLPQGAHYPLLKNPFYKGLHIDFLEISQSNYEKEKKESLTKIYFKGFPPGISTHEVELTFNRFGKIQFVFIMKPRGYERSSFGHGYLFFSCRAEVENLLRYPGKLYFDGYRIKFEEFKSTIPGKNFEHNKNPVAVKKLRSISMLEMDPVKESDPESIPTNPGVWSQTIKDSNVHSLQRLNRPFLANTAKVGCNHLITDNVRFNLTLTKTSNAVVSPPKNPTTPLVTSKKISSAIGTSVITGTSRFK